MKYLFGIFLYLVMISAIATAQQSVESKPARQTPPPAIKPTAEVLMKAQAAADKAQSSREESSIEALKKLIRREIAKSVSMPVVISVTETGNSEASNKE